MRLTTSPHNSPMQSRLLDQARTRLCLKHYRERTEPACIHWTKRVILFHKKRHPKEMDEKKLNEFIARSKIKTGVTKHTECHTLRHIFATHLIENGYNIHTIQELSEHKNLNTTTIFAHVINKGGMGLKNPVDDI